MLSVYTRTDYNNTVYVTTKAGGPAWSDVVRRVVFDLDSKKKIQDIYVKDTPVGYNWHASLPEGTKNIRTQLYWEEPAETTMHGNVHTHRGPKANRSVVFDDRLPPPPISDLAEVPPFPIFTTTETQTEDAHPTEARIKQKEKLKAEKEAGIKPRKIK